MPGVVVTTAVRGGTPATAGEPSGQFFLVGQFERGPVGVPVKCRSMADVQNMLGSRPAYGSGWDQLNTFFSEGGRLAYVVRIVGTAPTAGTLTINDRKSGTPVPTLKFDAASPGAWSSNLTVQIKDGPSEDTFRITVISNGKVVEDYTNLSSPADAVTKFSKSNYVKVTNLGSATPAPDNIPAVSGPTALSAGDDKRSTITNASYVAGLDLFDSQLGDGAVAIPGQTGPDVHSALLDHAKSFNRVALLAATRGETKDALQAIASGIDSEFAGLFAPWVVIPDGNTGQRVISPEGFVAGLRAKAHALVGPWKAPAGKSGISNFVTDIDQVFGDDDGNDLDAAKVSVIRKKGGAVRLYGWRSLSMDSDNWYLLKDRDLMNRLTVEAYVALEDYVFETIDPKGQLFSAIQARLVGLLQPIADAGGLYSKVNEETGDEVDPGYLVDTSTAINTIDTLARNEVHAQMSVRVSPTGSLVTLSIVKVGLLAGL